MEDVNGNLTNDDLEEIRNKITALEMDIHFNGTDHRLEIKKLKEQLKGHEQKARYNMELKDTVEMMNSTDYKERFKAEYHQTKIRYERLKAFNNKKQPVRNTYKLLASL